MATWPAKTNYATGDVLTATQMNDIGGELNDLYTASGFAAGKNKIINGDFGIWQRGTSFSNTTNGYTSDRWLLQTNGSPTTMTTSQQTFTPGTAPVSGYEGTYFYRNLITTVGTLTAVDLSQRIEDVRTLAGQTATLSFWAKADTARTLTVYAAQNFGSGGSATVTLNPSGDNFSLTTSWQRFSITYSIPSISGKTIGTGSYFTSLFRQPIAAGSQLDIWGVQLEAGSIATPFQTATGTKQGELAACQRYYVRWGGSNIYERIGLGIGATSTAAKFVINQPVAMRIAPSAIDYSTISLYDTATITAATNVTISAAGKLTTEIEATVASGLTAFRPYQIMTNNSLNGYVGLSAEL